ncbi:MAG TPA: UDP-N-acetylmuramoyl-L-alanyl-D-glutamate--2,6-diaminopimelate ligase [Pyrinomonadaceae bacterium]|jgi:UDP-N-acetylmuramyl-tripeptide synthetase|nr:UDP-N-acetylmuramoyl-L-alanyl-D-glutamate--2,6-diaminopimelate ligase [Pyrinomonadaceae bacterium]
MVSESKDQKRPVTLGEVARATGAKSTGDEDSEVFDVTHDSRQAREGTLFVAIRGGTLDAHRFVEQAMGRGAVGVVSERPRPEDFRGAWLEVADARRALAQAAATVHNHPSRELNLVGITGTNGKTTTTYLVGAISEAAGECVAMTGTVEYRIANERCKAERTTPEASDMQRYLRRAVEAGCRTAIMECSSQAIDLHRCDALDFSVAVWTNLTRDHLDYHKTMEAYFAAKRRLFDGSLGSHPRVSVLNLDDAHGLELARDLEGKGLPVIRYALHDPSAEVTATEVEHSLDGMRFNLHTPGGRRQLSSPLVGRPHIYNILAATATGLALGYELDTICRALETCAGAPGRFERVPHDEGFAVVVDYAHTDDALVNVLRTARGVAAGRIITVFGCGGDRDRSKRAPMGEAAASLSDIVILTSDNPRTEDPEKILADVEQGMRLAGKPYQKIADRRAAIHYAIKDARAGDLVLIAGKGHEDYQLIGDARFHFDDKEVAREALAARSRKVKG